MIQGDIFDEFHILSFLSGSHIGVRHVFTKIKNELLHFCLVLGDVFDVEHEGNRKYIKAVEGVPGAMLPQGFEESTLAGNLLMKFEMVYVLLESVHFDPVVPDFAGGRLPPQIEKRIIWI